MEDFFFGVGVGVGSAASGAFAGTGGFVGTGAFVGAGVSLAGTFVGGEVGSFVGLAVGTGVFTFSGACVRTGGWGVMFSSFAFSRCLPTAGMGEAFLTNYTQPEQNSSPVLPSSVSVGAR